MLVTWQFHFTKLEPRWTLLSTVESVLWLSAQMSAGLRRMVFSSIFFLLLIPSSINMHTHTWIFFLLKSNIYMSLNTPWKMGKICRKNTYNPTSRRSLLAFEDTFFQSFFSKCLWYFYVCMGAFQNKVAHTITCLKHLIEHDPHPFYSVRILFLRDAWFFHILTVI